MSDRKVRGGDGDIGEASAHQAVARYLADMTGQLESMARASKLELLAYLLAMAKAEAESQARAALPGHASGDSHSVRGDTPVG